MMLVLLAAALTPMLADSEWEVLRDRVENAPPAVAMFIERRAGCNHFRGEEAYDRARRAEIKATMRGLKCDRLAKDERSLRLAHRDGPAVLELLTDTASITGW